MDVQRVAAFFPRKKWVKNILVLNRYSKVCVVSSYLKVHLPECPLLVMYPANSASYPCSLSARSCGSADSTAPSSSMSMGDCDSEVEQQIS